MSDLYSDDENAKMLNMSQNGIEVDWLSGLCPVQANGWIDGHAFYFRARGDQWSIAITRNVTLTLDDALSDDCWKQMEHYGVFPEAGYMPFMDALDRIQWGANLFRRERKLNLV